METIQKNTPTLKTERLILRKFEEKDMEALFQILKDEEANRFLPWYPVKNLEEISSKTCKVIIMLCGYVLPGARLSFAAAPGTFFVLNAVPENGKLILIFYVQRIKTRLRRRQSAKTAINTKKAVKLPDGE